MTKVLFLDIDGVLNTPRMTGRFGFDFIDSVLVALVARIVRETEAKIVLSSTWRINEKDCLLATRELADHGLEIHDHTPVLTGGGWAGGRPERRDEIRALSDEERDALDAALDHAGQRHVASLELLGEDDELTRRWKTRMQSLRGLLERGVESSGGERN